MSFAPVGPGGGDAGMAAAAEPWLRSPRDYGKHAAPRLAKNRFPVTLP
jgi:hypothetical protein